MTSTSRFNLVDIFVFIFYVTSAGKFLAIASPTQQVIAAAKK